MNHMPQAPETGVTTTDRVVLEVHGVRFTHEGMIFPRGTARGPAIVSESLGRRSTLVRYHLPAPSLLEVSLNSVRQGDQEISRELTIPLEGPFQFAQVRNLDPAFLAEYQDYSHSSMSGTWSNEYSHHPVGPGVAIAEQNALDLG